MTRIRRLAALALAAATAGAPARALDWRIGGFVSQRIEADTNVDLDPNDSQAAYGSITDVGVSFRADTKTTTWFLAPGVRGSVYVGPGGGGDLNDVQPRFNGSVTHRAPRYQLNGALSVVPEFGSQADFGDNSNTGNTLLTINGETGIVYSLDSDDRLSVNGFVTLREFTSSLSSFSPTTTWGSSVSWARDLTPRTTGSVTTSFRNFDSQDADNQHGQTYEIRLGATHQATRRFSFDASGGVSLTDSTRDLAGGGSENDRAIGFVGGISGTFAATQATRFSAGIEQTVDQTALGEIESRIGLTLGASHAINPRASIGMDARLGFQNPTFSGPSADNRRTLSVAPSFSYELNADWRASAGYILRAEDQDAGTAVSNLVFLSISRGLDFLP